MEHKIRLELEGFLFGTQKNHHKVGPVLPKRYVNSMDKL